MYANLEDLKKRLKSNYSNIYSDDAGIVDESLMTGDLNTAAAEVNASIAKRYTVPVVETDALPMLKAWQLALAVEAAWSRVDIDELPGKVKDAAKIARDQMKALAAGNFTLPAAPAESTGGAGGAVIIKAEKPVFGRSNMEGF